MTALDPTPIVRDLREERRVLGQYRPETVDRLIATTERTGELPIPQPRPTWTPSPMPRGGRSTFPPDRNAAPDPFRSSYCNELSPRRILLCGEAPGHRGDHRAYGMDDRVLGEWSSSANAAANATADTRESGS